MRSNRRLTFRLDLSTLKAIEKEFLVVNDLNSWDMLVLDDEGEELKRFEGNGHGAPGYARAIKTKYSDDDEFVMWLKSPCEISIMDLSDFSEIHLENF